MSKWKKNKNVITEHAAHFGRRNKEYTVLPPNAVMAKIAEIRSLLPPNGKDWTAQRVCDTLNSYKIIHGHWNGQGNPHFTPNTICHMYHSYSDTTFGGARFKKPSAQTTLPGLGHVGRTKPGPKAQSTPQAKAFVRRHPTFTIISKTAFKKFVFAAIAEDRSGMEIAEALSNQKLLRPTYTGGSPKWNVDTVADLFKRLNHGQTISEVRLHMHGTKRARTVTPKPEKEIKQKRATPKKPVTTWLTMNVLPEVESMRFVPGKTGNVQFIFSREGSLKDPEVLQLFNTHYDKLLTD